MASVLAANALCKLATVKAELGVGIETPDTTQDAAIERMINAASDAAESFCGRKFNKATVTSERHRGSGTHRLVLNRVPIVGSLTSVTFDDATVDSASYYVEDAVAGIVWKDTIWKAPEAGVLGSAASDLVPHTGERLYKVIYVGGYVLPASGEAVIGTTNMRVPLDIGGTDYDVDVTAATYSGGTAMAAALQSALNASPVGVSDRDFTVSFDTTTEKFTITKAAGTFKLEWLTRSTNSIGAILGASTAADTAAATSHVMADVYAGTRDLPYDIEHAALEAVVALFRSRGQSRESGLNVGIGRGLGGGVLPDSVLPVLEKHRRWWID